MRELAAVLTRRCAQRQDDRFPNTRPLEVMASILRAPLCMLGAPPQAGAQRPCAVLCGASMGETRSIIHCLQCFLKPRLSASGTLPPPGCEATLQLRRQCGSERNKNNFGTGAMAARLKEAVRRHPACRVVLPAAAAPPH